LVDCAEDVLGEKIERVVITVPAYFDNAQREATKEAGRIAELEVMRTLNEPTAAALAYGLEKEIKGDEKILVYDLGGGTFDVSILEISEEDGQKTFDVIGVSGINDLGGDDFNKKIVDYSIEKFKEKSGIDLRTYGGEEEIRKNLRRLEEGAEGAKHDLSGRFQTEIFIPYIAKNISLQVPLTRATFENMTRDYLLSTAKQVDITLRDAKIKKEDIRQVILVGGSTRMPMVENLIREKFGSVKINKTVNPDEVVAIGAAIQGAVLSGDIKNIVTLDVTPLSLGLEVEGGLNDIIIERNRKIPTKETKIYSTAVDNQPSVHIKVLQGERSRAIDNQTLNIFELTGIELAPRGVPQIEVEFSIDSNGILKVAAKDKKSNKEKSITIEKSARSLSDEEIKQKQEEAEKYRELDERIRRDAQDLNKAQSFLHTFTRQIEEFKKHKDFKEDDPQFQEFKKLYDNLKNSIEAVERANDEEREAKCSELREQVKKVEDLMKLANELSQKMPKGENNNKEKGEEPTVVQPEEIKSN
jgi:molecular chaperone DnaK